MQLFTEPEKICANTVSEKNAHVTEGENLDTQLGTWDEYLTHI